MTGNPNKWFPWLPVVGLCLAIFVQSCFPSADPGPDFAFKDKWLHLAAYGLLAFLFSRAWRLTWPDRLTACRLMLVSICFASLYGLSDELHQALVATRHASVTDALANVVGSALGAVIYLKVADRRRQHRLSAGGGSVGGNADST
jgi:VanZ family protein